jgi:hypothetical protein
MKIAGTPIIAGFAAATLVATFAFAQPSTAVRAASPFAGTWEGKIHDLPGIRLKIEDTGGKIGGTIVFYFQERTDVNSPWHVASESPLPLLAPRVEAKALTFEVQHHKCHGCAELGPNVRFRVDLAGPNELRLWKLDEGGAAPEPGAGLRLIRQTSSQQP